MACYQSYIICTSPRSGSTMLCGLLAATGKSGKPDSHFHSPCLEDWMRYYEIPLDRFTDHRDLLVTIFEAARDRGDGNTGIFGLRMQSQSFDFFREKLRYIWPDYSNDVERIQQTFGPTLFIHLTRKNKLEQAISLVKATQTGLWHQAADGTELERTSAPQEPVYDAIAIAQSLAELTQLDEQWASWFANEGLVPLCVDYDHLSADPTGVLADVLDHLGLARYFALGLSPPVSRLADATNKDWAKRFNSDS